MNPVNPAESIDLSDGAVAIPDRTTFETLSYQHAYADTYVKFILLGMDTERPSVYFINVKTHETHRSFLGGAVGSMEIRRIRYSVPSHITRT